MNLAISWAITLFFHLFAMMLMLSTPISSDPSLARYIDASRGFHRIIGVWIGAFGSLLWDLAVSARGSRACF